jgi:hypothetical protein
MIVTDDGSEVSSRDHRTDTAPVFDRNSLSVRPQTEPVEGEPERPPAVLAGLEPWLPIFLHLRLPVTLGADPPLNLGGLGAIAVAGLHNDHRIRRYR